MPYTSLKDDYIIFLDFDGVLNHAGCNPETNFLQSAITVLNNIYDEFHAKIVLSTSWKDAFIFTDLVNLLQDKGIKAPVIDKTPTYVGPVTNKSYNITEISEEDFNDLIDPMAGRNGEIITFIKLHDIKHYVVLDDCKMTNPELFKHQVLTCYFDKENGGLQLHHESQIREILKKET